MLALVSHLNNIFITKPISRISPILSSILCTYLNLITNYLILSNPALDLKAQNPGGHVIGVSSQDRTLPVLNHSKTLAYPKRVKRLSCDIYGQETSPAAVSSLDLSQDSPVRGDGAGFFHSRNSPCAIAGDHDSTCSTSGSGSSSSSSSTLIQLWMQYTDGVGAGLFRAPQGPLFFSEALGDGANRALHPRKAIDVVGNKQGRGTCFQRFLNC